MSVKIRLARHGRKKRPFYRLVVADSRSARDGRFVDIVGTYNPLANPTRVSINQEKALHWLGEGVEMTETAKSILDRSGVMARYRDAKAGNALTEEEFKISVDLFKHELDAAGSKRKGKRKVVSGPSEEVAAAAGGAVATDAPKEDAPKEDAPAEAAAEAPAEAPAAPAEAAPAAEEPETPKADE